MVVWQVDVLLCIYTAFQNACIESVYLATALSSSLASKENFSKNSKSAL